ncbi:alpha-enolase-like isoform X1 [Lampetra fluviatilis]
MSVLKIHARQIFDSRGNPTVEVDLYTHKGLFRASVPSGVSRGAHEPTELRDGDKTRFFGQGVSRVVKYINQYIGPALCSQDVNVKDQEKIDDLLVAMDGTANLSRFGCNGLLGVSVAVCKAGAVENDVPLYKHIAHLAGNTNLVLPVPVLNVLAGGLHADGGGVQGLQEVLVLPVGASSLHDAVRRGAEVHHALHALLRERQGVGATNVGDQGAFSLSLPSAREALQLVREAVQRSGNQDAVVLGIDAAASDLHVHGMYRKRTQEEGQEDSLISADTLAQSYRDLAKDFQVVSFEDPFDQDDWTAWSKFTESGSFQVVGDSLTVSSESRVELAAGQRACNSLTLSLTHTGTLTQTIRAWRAARRHGWGVVVSHRSGETEDPFIADLAVGLGAGQIKTGAACRSERLAKYNQLMRIEEELGSEAKYAGRNYRNPHAG